MNLELMLAIKERRREAQAQLDEAMSDLRDAIVVAYFEGTPVSTIAVGLGISRQTVYTVLKDRNLIT